jgi:two-component system, OmpR family, response regulator
MAKIALHVDNEPIVIKLVRATLERAGYQVVSALNTAEALRTLEMTRPSLIILDVNIGEESGYNLCKLIRQYYPDVKAAVAFLTANRTVQDLETAKQVRGDYFILKPFTPATLLEGIEKAIAARQKVMRQV